MWQALSGGAQYGVAKNVNLVGVRVLGCDSRGSTEAIVRGIDWVAQNASGPSVANLSLGGESLRRWIKQSLGSSKEESLRSLLLVTMVKTLAKYPLHVNQVASL